MSRVRTIAVLVLLCGVALGTITDTAPTREPVKVDGYDVMSGDFHVHAFIGDGGVAPWMMPGQAVRAGLDVVAITNHDQTFAGRLGRWAARRFDGPLIIVGEEVTGRDFHLIAVGIERPVNWDQPVRSAIADVHEQGGLAIAAHPIRGFGDSYDEQALGALDGVEAAYSKSLPPQRAKEVEAFYHRTLAHNPGVATIGSTDSHTDGPLGVCRTYLLVRERNESGVLDAIRDGRTVGYCESNPPGNGRLQGRPEFVRLLEPHRDALAPPQDGIAQQGATVVVWLALIALALVGTRSA